MSRKTGSCADCGSQCDHRAERCLECANRRQIGARCGPSSPGWKGGRVVTQSGYVRLNLPDHIDADCAGYVYEHRFVAATTLGRPLEAGEVVHHINGVRSDNRPENLEVLSSREHAERHARARGSLSDREIEDLLRSGKSAWSIARYHGVSDRRAIRIRRSLGMPARVRGFAKP